MKSANIDLSKYILFAEGPVVCRYCRGFVCSLTPRLSTAEESKTSDIYFLCGFCGLIDKAGEGEVAPPEPHLIEIIRREADLEGDDEG